MKNLLQAFRNPRNFRASTSPIRKDGCEKCNGYLHIKNCSGCGRSCSCYEKREKTEVKIDTSKLKKRKVRTVDNDVLIETFLRNYKKSVDCGFTEVRIRAGKLHISHGGNMGNTVETHVNENLALIGLPKVAFLKKKFPKFSESGSPDYLWEIKFTIN